MENCSLLSGNCGRYFKSFFTHTVHVKLVSPKAAQLGSTKAFLSVGKLSNVSPSRATCLRTYYWEDGQIKSSVPGQLEQKVFLESTVIACAPDFLWPLEQWRCNSRHPCSQLTGLLQKVAWVIICHSDCSSCCCSFGYKKLVGRLSLEKLYELD